MKLKRLLAASLVATIASSAVMAEGAYVGSEYSIHDGSDINKGLDIYAGYEVELLTDLTLDGRIDYIDTNLDNYYVYSAELTKEFDGLELYGKFSKGNSTVYTIGARYNF